MRNPAKFIGAALAATAIVFAAAQAPRRPSVTALPTISPQYRLFHCIRPVCRKLKELSKGTMLVDQYPGAQLGQEPQLLQLVKAGDLDFAIISSANTSTISPQAGVMSLHFLFRDENHVIKALGDPKVFEAFAT